MSGHATHRTHANSETVLRDIHASEDRRKEVLRAYEELDAATDREIARHLGHTDMNSVRPTITNLVNDGVLLEVGDRKCNVTHYTVRVCRRAIV